MDAIDTDPNGRTPRSRSTDQPDMNEGTMMKDLNYELNRLLERNRDGSYATQAERRNALRRMARELEALGFRNLRASSLSTKHVDALIGAWSQRRLSIGSIKNNLAHLRWWAERVGKAATVASKNDIYGIARREYVTDLSKARDDEDVAKIDAIADFYVKLALRFQVTFGLRKEESMKLRPRLADRGDRLWLKGSWTKGGREREIPIRTEAQRRLLEDAKTFAGAGSLIPPEKRYVEQEKHLERVCASAGIHKMHGFRHRYAQLRYREMTGFECPAAGGKASRELSLEEQKRVREARLMIALELGHAREQVTVNYFGR